MMATLPCSICGMPAGNTCSVCGKRACNRHYDRRLGTCTSCKAGKRMK